MIVISFLRTHPRSLNGDGRTVLCADWCGHRLSVQRVTAGELWHASLDGRPLGCWHGLDRAKAATEWAALAPKPRGTRANG